MGISGMYIPQYPYGFLYQFNLFFRVLLQYRTGIQQAGTVSRCANGIIGISQGHDVFTKTLIYGALPELYAILALVATFMV